jgi:hypothetical protein
MRVTKRRNGVPWALLRGFQVLSQKHRFQPFLSLSPMAPVRELCCNSIEQHKRRGRHPWRARIF